MGVRPVTLLLSRCGERDVALSPELDGDLPAERRLVNFGGPVVVGAQLEAAAKKACFVCSPSARISLPSRFIVLSSSLSAAR